MPMLMPHATWTTQVANMVSYNCAAGGTGYVGGGELGSALTFAHGLVLIRRRAGAKVGLVPQADPGFACGPNIISPHVSGRR
jgi:hypothetical protein